MTPCAKRCYASRSAAKAAHTKAGHRIRVYLCRDCKRWHVTNQDKHGRETRPTRSA
jgi:hypothetical protein